MRWASLAAALLVLPGFSGCALMDQGPGEETMVVSNRSAQPVSMILRVTTYDRSLTLFSQEFSLQVGAARDIPLDLTPGSYRTTVVVSNGIHEDLVLEIADKGNSRIELLVFAKHASLTVSSD